MMKKRIIFGMLSLLALVFIATGCSNKGKNEESASNDESLKLWVGLNQGATYRKLAKEFEKEEGVKVEVVELEEADDGLLKDVEAAADVLWVQSDQLGQLIEAGTVYENEKYAKETKSENSEFAVKGASYEEKLYGYPTNVSSMFLFYDKRVFGKEDLETLDTIFAKGKVGLNIEEAGADYRLTPWFISNGAYLYGKDGQEVDGSTLNNEQGLNVLKWISKAKENPNLVAVNADEISALKEGKINALFSGNWNIENIKEVLGDNMGVAMYPKADFGDGEVKLRAFSGVPIFVVNSASKNPGKAMDLAHFITNKEAQLLQFKEIGGVPSNTEAYDSAEVQKDEPSKIIGQMVDEQSVLMPALPEMKNFWPNMNALLVDTYQGKVKEADMQSKLDKLVKDIAKPVEK